MKKLVGQIREYLEGEWHPVFFTLVAAFLVVSFYVNYAFDPETKILKIVKNPLYQIGFYLLFYTIPYFVTLAAYALTTGKSAFFRDRGFWLLSAVCFPVLATYTAMHNVPWYVMKHWPALVGFIPMGFRHYLARYGDNVLPGLVMIVPVAAYWRARDRRESRLYGFSAAGIDLRTYLWILLFLVPLVFLASFGGDFQAAYPRYRFSFPAGATGGLRAGMIAIFEVCYGLDFVAVELLFRGFMVMAFARFLGAAAIMPMVVVYAFIHFQKPLGETLGSVIGGMVLGIVSYRTRSIYGGIVLHLGLAYSMELSGAVQHALRHF